MNKYMISHPRLVAVLVAGSARTSCAILLSVGDSGGIKKTVVWVYIHIYVCIYVYSLVGSQNGILQSKERLGKKDSGAF